MEGYFESFFKGKKENVDKIVSFIYDRAGKGDQMYSVIRGMIKLPNGYDSMSLEKEVEIEIGMQTDGYGSRNINFFLNDEYFNDLANIAPDVYIRGNYRLLDNGTIWNYVSQSGDDTVDSYFTYECRYCSKIIGEEDLDNAISLEDGDMVCSKECLKGFISELLEDCDCDDICPNCEDELDEDCFVDDNGHRFCSEECYEEFKEQYNLEVF